MNKSNDISHSMKAVFTVAMAVVVFVAERDLPTKEEVNDMDDKSVEEIVMAFYETCFNDLDDEDYEENMAVIKMTMAVIYMKLKGFLPDIFKIHGSNMGATRIGDAVLGIYDIMKTFRS
mmetsp:Transcript_24634/g.61530  ORF Transcript_24634/g.61530 Transcript_24634/m.61530 type:complete len:119 (+) Transcript_24634:661-1017(+)|eukprot:CAMPEP_0174895040 /NCGR_PEP_ID=MMETSP0167-20121228/9535_1 /TAXON_ID=38298 /ORGANISM="Rhodella maculata, Strain CCMP736" /LENGTH=118 /DNA_ID=CAMNT_0016134281 /DNA_START=601 /DNA_END=957 /DNA_ORIENTATION=+